MSKKLFKTIRKSYLTGTLLTGLMSNLMVFGQPIQQMYQVNSQLKVQKKYPVLYNNKSSLGIEGSYEVFKHTSSSSNYKDDFTNAIVSKNNVFYAHQHMGIIGRAESSDRENPRDNFFNLTIPQTFNPNQYDAILKYDIYGVDQGNQTVKSINDQITYGGQVVKISNQWKSVEENLPTEFLKVGDNQIFFNRSADELYLYKVKNLRVELVNKQLEAVVVTDTILKNYNGNVYLSGFVSNKVEKLLADKTPITLVDGTFNAVLEKMSPQSKSLTLQSYLADGSIGEIQVPVVYESEDLDFKFKHQNISSDYSVLLSPEIINFKEASLEPIVTNQATLNGSVRFTGLAFKSLKPLNSDIVNVTAGDFKGYRIELEDDIVKDSVAMKVHLKYDKTKIPKGYGLQDVRVFAFDNSKHEWIVLPVENMDIEKQTVSAFYNGETDYINGVVKVPEMAETSSFAPTMITDMEYANPAAGVVSVAPPTPNNTGTVNTSFPIKLPAGRNGMMPSLSVNYNSEGGNGWMGLGWDMQLPAITLDTRWGVPRFDTINESEIYQLNGETMVLKIGDDYTNPHRHSEDIARLNQRTFYLRKEGGFQKIVRYGDSPENYRWVVWDKYGNRNLYGGGVAAVSENSVIRDASNNITHWALYKSFDTFENYVQYSYVKNNITVNGVEGTYFYPDWIRYTLKGNGNTNYYQVKFKRNTYTVGEAGVASREDAVLNARTGTMMITDQLLTEVNVNFRNNGQWELVRTYRFDYNESPFNKTQLSKISEYDSENNLFYNNSFEYYDDLGSSHMVAGDPITWNGASAELSSTLEDIASGGVANLLPDGSALGTSTSSGFSSGLRGGFGLGYNPASVSVTVGGSVNYSQSKQKSKISFIDINGDGLPDKVYKANDGKLWYLPNLGVSYAQNGVFGAPQTVLGWTKLDETKSRTSGAGWDANATIIGVGRSRSRTRSTTDNYFTDFNGDGLVDVIGGGAVRFNSTESWSYPSQAKFTALANLTPNPINSGALNDGLIANLELETENMLRSDHSQFDHVKVWQAQHNGTININSVATLINKNTCTDNAASNQFRLTIERGEIGQTSVTTKLLERVLININQTQNLNLGNIAVDKDDVFFFRIHNESYGCGGEIEWNPEINYFGFVPGQDLAMVQDDNDKQIRDFKADEDFIINNGGNWMPNSNDTSITINPNLGGFTPYQFSDNLYFVIEKTTNTHSLEGEEEGQIEDTTVDRWVVRKYVSTTGTIESVESMPSGFLNVSNQYGTNALADKSYSYRFFVESTSNVQWKNIAWQPIISANNTGDQYPGVDYLTYDNNVNQKNYHINGTSLPNVNIDSDIPGDAQAPMLRISNNIFQQELLSEFLTNFDENSPHFPLKINWVVKERIGTIVKPLHVRTFFLHRLEYDDPWIGDDSWTYEFRDLNNNVINMIDDQDYFLYDLTKQQVQDIKTANGKLYSAFYIDYSNFGNNNPLQITVNLHPDQSGFFFPQILQRPFLSKELRFFGISNRGWGEFLYNGGVQYDYDTEGNIIGDNDIPHHNFEGNIDMSVFNFNTTEADINNSINNASSFEDSNLNGINVRYTRYGQNNELLKYLNKSIKNYIDLETGDEVSATYGYNDNNQLTALVGRFGESDIYNLYVDPDDLANGNGFAALKQRSISKGKARSGNIGFQGNGVSGTESEARSKVLNQYVDVNGDRYPDVVTNGSIQMTNMRGGLFDSMQNGFVSGSESQDKTQGVNIAGMFPNSTSSDNGKDKKATRSNISAGLSSSDEQDCYTYNVRQWTDINGDGLSDKVTLTTSDVFVELNTGYGFANPVSWGTFSGIYASNRSSSTVGASFGTASYAFGFGGGESTANANTILADVNGDGLPDVVKRVQWGANYEVYLNNGAGFESNPQHTFYSGLVDQDYSLTGNVFGSYTYGMLIQIWVLTFKVTLTGTLGANAGFNEKRITVQDMDGDGLLDVLQKGDDNGDVIAHLNKTGKTNLLKKVNLPLGGHWIVEYEREGNTYDLPQNKWVMQNVRTEDGFAVDNGYSPGQTLTTVSYNNPKHDRREREFLGFGEVRVDEKHPNTEDTYRYAVMEYHNDNVYLKGLQKHTMTYDASDDLLSENTTLYTIMDPETPQVNMGGSEENNYLQVGLDSDLLDYSRLFVAPVKTVNTTYENGEGLSLEQQFLAYDDHGNLLTYKNLGDTYTDAAGFDAYRTEMEYFNGVSGVNNALGYVKKLQVFREHDNQLMRQREATYHSGKINTVKTKLNASEFNTVSIGYDNYGNAISSTLDNDFQNIITYDNKLHTYPVSVSNTFGETSSSVYNYLFGVPVLVTDTNGHQMRTRIDNRGRVVEVAAPNEMQQSADWTIRMQYQGGNAVPVALDGSEYLVLANASEKFEALEPGEVQTEAAKNYAVTRHKVQQAYGGQLLTVSMIDGLGKPIQLKKTQYVNDSGSGQVGWLINGKETKDAFGRVLESRLPTFVTTGYPLGDVNNIQDDAFNYESDESNIPATLMTYDAKDRVLNVTQPGESQSATIGYGIEDGMFVTTTTNELSQTMRTFADISRRRRKIVQNEVVTTRFYYNAVGEKIKVKNQQGYETFYKYDMAGRRTEERHPDHGLQVFEYDVVGNLTKRYTSNLLAEGADQAINYQYDYNRLVEINYPQNPENDVEYIYGDAGNLANAKGRIYMQKDASGVQVFGYDKLGNLDRHLRGVAVAGRHTFWYETRWNYDSFNRVRTITYPDAENVNYNYNGGGNLMNIRRTIPSGVEDGFIVSNIKYNDLGERTEIQFGNGTSTVYTYDNRRRLQNLGHQFSGFDTANTYQYDVLGNVTQIQTQEPNNSLPNVGQIGGAVTHNYTYDDFNRLVSADGRYTGANDHTTPYLAQEYALTMEYDEAHNIIKKTQTHIQGAVANHGSPITNSNTVLETNYHLEYSKYAEGAYVSQTADGEFGYVQPHAPREIVEKPENGDLQETDPNYKRQQIEYDANGNQVGITQVVTEASQDPAYYGIVEQETMVLRKNLWDEEDRLRAVDLNPEEEKIHPLAIYTYDVKGQRVVRYIHGRADVKSNAADVSFNERDEVMLYPNGLVTAKVLSKPGIEPSGEDHISRYTKHYYIGAERIQSTLGTMPNLGLYPKIDSWQNQNVIRPMANQSVIDAGDALEDTYEDLGQSITLEDPTGEGNMGNYLHDPSGYHAYWYHSDHLGSSSYISNENGIITQHIEYLPFGETLVDEHLNSYNTPYKFNGKELDEETGNYYYGARYYNPKWSLWLSVDPLARYNPILEVEFYGDGQHNGGDFNNKNGNGYGYCYQSPIRYLDPNGKQVDTAEKKAIETAARELSKSYVDDAGKLVLKGGKISFGLVLGTVSMILTPTSLAEPQPFPPGKSIELEPKIMGDEVGYFPGSFPSTEVRDKDNSDEIIYRSGSFTDNNFTPRPGTDDGIGPKSGLSTNKDPLKATQGRGGKVQGLSTKMLKKMGFRLKEVDGHVGIRPPSQKLLEEWAKTKGLSSDSPHILTKMVKSARVIEVKLPKQ